MSTQTKCGFVAIIGRPNAGKSTLTNQLVGGKVSIVTHKAQTTRQRILGICVKDNAQLILMDTPGIFSADKKLDKAMVKAAWEASEGADRVLVLMDAQNQNVKPIFEIIEKLNGRPFTLVLNKIDTIAKEKLLKLSEQFSQFPNLEKTFMISALTGNGVLDLLEDLYKTLPEGQWLYPEDQLTDLPERLWAAEITREQIFLRLHQELPYEIFVETEAWETFDNGSVKINQLVYVARDSHKAILLGKRGQQIKQIGQLAREEMTLHMGHPVHLFIHVKVLPDWYNKPHFYKLMGLG